MEAPLKTFSSVQALRGVAALAVVFFHGVIVAQENNWGGIFDFRGGESGVDLFFAISGFVMVMSTARWWGDSVSWRPFLLRRFIRIVPLYWMFTGLKILSMGLFPGMIRHSILNWHLIIASFLFIPAWNEGHGAVAPLLPVGWTLHFEMFFYLLLALSLAVSKNPIRLVSLLLISLVGISFFRTATWGAPTALLNPILLEFVFGIVIALAVRAGRLLPVKVASILAAAMVLLLLSYPHPFTSVIAPLAPDNREHYRPLLRGIPCALFLYAAVSLERSARRWLVGLPELLGDASYSVYLSHAFVIPVLGAIWLKWAWTGTLAASAFIAVCLIACAVVGILVHRLLEIPMLHYLNQKVRQPDPVGIRASG